MVKPIEGIRKEWQCHFTDDCVMCSNKNLCLSATAFNTDLRRYLFYRMHRKEKENAAMRAGTLKHEEALKDIKTIKEYGFVNFRKDLFDNKIVRLQEVMICSPRLGLRGKVDNLNIMLSGNTIKVSARELKSKWFKKYLNQIAVYGMMLSDPQCRIIEEVTKRKTKRKSRYLYPQSKKFIFDIDLVLQIFEKKGRIYGFTKDNIKTEWGNGMSMYINRLSKGYRQLHKLNYYYLSEIPICKPCWKLCGFKSECDKSPYVQNNVKTKQRYFSKVLDKRLLVKSKPNINIARL